MADEFIYPDLDEITELFDGDFMVADHDVSGSIETNSIKLSNVVQELLFRTNYRINRSVPSANLLVELKNANNSDASANRPLSFSIAGQIRKLTGALSVQVNSSTNTFNLGSTMFANIAQELFVYVGWRASTSTVFLLLSRISYAKEYADFSSSATDERYGAYSGAAPVGADPVKNIGRVNVQNTGSAFSYQWSIPAGDTIINHPIFQTNWLDYLPTFAGFTATVPTGVHRYRFNYSTASLFARQTANGTSNANNFTMSLPFTAKTITNMAWGSMGGGFDNSVLLTAPILIRVLSAATVMDVFKDFNATTNWTTSNGKRITQMNVLQYEFGV